MNTEEEHIRVTVDGLGRRSSHGAPERPRIRWPYTVLAYAFAALALLGVVIPGLPTTPFVLLAAWAASRGSERIHVWLRDHRRLGPPLRDWREQGAVSLRGKSVATAFLVLSWTILLLRGTAPWILAALGALFISVAVFVGTRPRPRT